MRDNHHESGGTERLANDLIGTLPSEVLVLDKTGLVMCLDSAFHRFAEENGAGLETIHGTGLNYVSAIRLTDSHDSEVGDVAKNGLLAAMSAMSNDFRLLYRCDTLTEALWFLMYVAPLGDRPGYVGVSHKNLADYKKAEEAFRSANRDLEKLVLERALELEHFFNVSLDMHCIANSEGYFLRVNPAFTDTLGWSEQELLAVPFVEFVHPDDRLATEAETQSLVKATVPQRFENRYQDKNGAWRILSWNSVTDENGLIFATARDVTDQRELLASLREAKEAAEKANQAKSEFLSRMSHELRTPMNAVLGYAQLLDLKHDDPIIKKATHAILKGGKHLLQLINEVLDLSRIESGHLGISLEPVSIQELISEAINLLRQVAEDAGVTVHFTGDCESLYVDADRQRFLQVLLNIVGNAIKYNHSGGHVEVRCLQTPEQAHRIEISDTGPGIPIEARELLFQPFQRFGDPGIDGAGLGLAVSQRFAKLMGGRLGLADSSPKGSTFFLELKSVQPPDQSPAFDVRGKPQSPQRSLTGTVLYIEDNLSNIDLITTVLFDWKNVHLVSVTQGQLGLDFASTNHTDLILLDVHLPDLMGDKVLERLKSTAATKDIPVVMLSADATRRQIDASLNAGAVEYLTKPLDIGRLYEILFKYLASE